MESSPNNILWHNIRKSLPKAPHLAKEKITQHLEHIITNTLLAQQSPDEALRALRHLQAAKKHQERKYKEILHQSRTDPLTELYNRRRFLQVTQKYESFRHSDFEDQRAGTDIFAMLDINNFKLVNDTLGHVTADTILRLVANSIKQDFPRDRGHAVCRYGGDEFLIYARIPHEQEDARFASALRHIEDAVQTHLNLGTAYFPLASLGYASAHGQEQLTNHELIELADQDMYRRKQRDKAPLVDISG